MEFKAHPYQNFSIRHIIDNPASGLFLDMGLGKSVISLTAINQLMYSDFEVNRVLIIAPKRVAEDTWTTEASKWDHLQHLRVSVVLGTERERKEALKAKADIYVINRENVAWLVGYYQQGFPFDMVVIDELTSFKSPKSVRFKALRMIRPKVKRVVGLTGTPAPNGLIDLWSQLYLLDMGERLGKTVTGYRQKYFSPGRTNGRVVFDYRLNKGSEGEIYKQISDICISMKAEDYLDLPELIFRKVKVRLSKEERAQYDKFEEQSVLELGENSEDISAVNAASLSIKLEQFANGAVYDEDKNVHEIHTAKIEALDELMEEANGKPVFVLYKYKHDLFRIQRYLKKYNPVVAKGPKDMAAWNRGEIPMYLAHADSVAYGLNMQEGGCHVVWFGPIWPLEKYLQTNKRLHRQGQKYPVTVTRIIVEDSIDERIADSNEGKKDVQDALMDAVKAVVNKYRRS